MHQSTITRGITAVIKSKQAYNWKMDSFAISQSDSGQKVNYHRGIFLFLFYILYVIPQTAQGISKKVVFFFKDFTPLQNAMFLLTSLYIQNQNMYPILLCKLSTVSSSLTFGYLQCLAHAIQILSGELEQETVLGFPCFNSSSILFPGKATF